MLKLQFMIWKWRPDHLTLCTIFYDPSVLHNLSSTAEIRQCCAIRTERFTRKNNKQYYQPFSGDIKQGEAGDCWFLSSLCAFADCDNLDTAEARNQFFHRNSHGIQQMKKQLKLQLAKYIHRMSEYFFNFESYCLFILPWTFFIWRTSSALSKFLWFFCFDFPFPKYVW